MPDADTTPVAAVQPAPPRPVRQHVGRALGLLRTFIAYGKKLADTLRQHADSPHGFPDFFSVTTIFRTGDVALILDRIARGLLRAAALEDRLNRLAARGRDLTPSPVRMPAACRSGAEAAAPMDDPADDQPDDPAPRAAPAPLPTTEDFIARDRRRPIGAVLVDICHDLGIAPGQVDSTIWNELRHHVITYGGSLVTLLFRRPPGPETPGVYPGYFTGPIPTAIADAPIPFPDWLAPESLAPAGTGPP